MAILLTDDVANRQKAEADGLTAVSGMCASLSRVISCSVRAIVRRYVEGLKDSGKLLDLLSAIGEDIEPTRAAAPRQALYPDVRAISASCVFSSLTCS